MNTCDVAQGETGGTTYSKGGLLAVAMDSPGRNSIQRNVQSNGTNDSTVDSLGTVLGVTALELANTLWLIHVKHTVHCYNGCYFSTKFVVYEQFGGKVCQI